MINSNANIIDNNNIPKLYKEKIYEFPKSIAHAIEISEMKNQNYDINYKNVDVINSFKTVKLFFSTHFLSNKKDKLEILKNEISNIKINKKSISLKKNLDKTVSNEDKILTIHNNKTNCYSYNFETFKDCDITPLEQEFNKKKIIKNKKENNKKVIFRNNYRPNKLNKDKQCSKFSNICVKKKLYKKNLSFNCPSSSIKNTNMNNIPKNKKYEELNFPKINSKELSYNKKIEYENISYLDKYEEIIMERKKYELKMHSIILNLSNDLKKIQKERTFLINNSNNASPHFSSKKLNESFKSITKNQIIKKNNNNNHNLNILNFQLTDSISLYDCQEVFKKIKPVKKTQENKSILNVQQNNKIIKLECEIAAKQKELHKVTKKLKYYYLDLLKEGIDTRKEGLSWIVKRLLRLNYTPKIENFPSCFNNKEFEYIINISKNKNKLYDLISEVQKINRELSNSKKYNAILNLKSKDNYNKNIQKKNVFFRNYSHQNFIKETNNLNDSNKLILISKETSRNRTRSRTNSNGKSNRNQINKDYINKKSEQYLNNFLIFKLPINLQKIIYYISNNDIATCEFSDDNDIKNIKKLYELKKEIDEIFVNIKKYDKDILKYLTIVNNNSIEKNKNAEKNKMNNNSDNTNIYKCLFGSKVK